MEFCLPRVARLLQPPLYRCRWNPVKQANVARDQHNSKTGECHNMSTSLMSSINVQAGVCLNFTAPHTFQIKTFIWGKEDTLVKSLTGS